MGRIQRNPATEGVKFKAIGASAVEAAAVGCPAARA